jgi:hypothetical protein
LAAPGEERQVVAACAELTLHFFDPDSAPIVALLLLALVLG